MVYSGGNYRTFTARWWGPLGETVLQSDGESLTALRFQGDFRGEGAAPFAGKQGEFPAEGMDALPVFVQTRRWLEAYFSGEEPDGLPAMSLCGTPFQCRVWSELMHVGYGETLTYGELGARLGCRSAQAVGQAVGRNPVALLVPCHRIVGRQHRLIGYAYGLARKLWLLDMEHPEGHFQPSDTKGRHI